MSSKAGTRHKDALLWSASAALVLALAFNLFRLAFLDNHDVYRCHALLNKGQWLDNVHNNWQPDGCLLHPYNTPKVRSCLESKRIVFIGDSVVRQTFWAAARVVDPNFAFEGEKHSSRTVTASNVTLDFFWDPFLNSSSSASLLSGNFVTGLGRSEVPALLVIGTGLWQLRDFESSQAIEQFQRSIDRVFAATELTSLSDELVLLPVENVVEDLLTPERRQRITNADINKMNEYVRTKEASLPLLSRPRLVSIPWIFNEMIAGAQDQTLDGIHYSDSICRAQANILLNFRCNDSLLKKFPIDKTCCATYPTPNYVQWLLLAFLAVYAPLGWYANKQDAAHPILRFYPPTDYILPLAVFNLSLVLIFLGDRSPYFLRAQKQYGALEFALLSLLSLAVGVLTMKTPEKGDLGFMNRDQTDEWKGWMQIAILIYHYLGASKISGIYNPIRVLVAAYLFMTGYGHFFFYYKKADYGFTRVFSVLVRLNLLPVALAYTMDTDWLSYYFSPLVSMWFGIIWLTMYAGHQWNASASFMLGKIAASAVLLTVFFALGWPLEGIFGFSNHVFGTEWSAREWTFRVTLDRYIPYVGMLAALAYIKISELHLTDRPEWPRWVTQATWAAGLVLAGFFLFELQMDKFTYNRFHPYVSALPVLAFAILRNATPFLRSTSSQFFMFFGQCSLETFIIQFHLWMAADTKGLLVFIPGTSFLCRFLNFVISTLIFVWISERVAWATGKLSAWVCLTKGGKSARAKATPASTPSNHSDANATSYIPLAATANGTLDVPASASGLPSPTTAPHPSSFTQLVVDDLRVRALFILGFLWLANIIYPGDAPPEGHLLPTH